MIDDLSGFDEGRLLLLTDLGPIALGVLVALSVLALAVTWLDMRDLPRRRAVTVTVLRGLALALAVFVVMEPAVELRDVTREKNHVLVLVDTSASQGLPLPDGEDRWDRTRGALDELRPLVEGASEAHHFDVFALTAELVASSIDALTDEGYAPEGDATHLLEVLRGVRDEYAPGELGGVVLVSDGIDNGNLSERVPRGTELDRETRELIASLGVPVHTIATAAEGDVRDVAIERVLYDDFAFVRNAIEVSVDVRALGYDDLSLPVTLRREGVPLQTRQVLMSADDDVQRVTFSFVPERIGKEIYTVDVPVLDGEAIVENNVEHFVLNVIRDRIRVLHVVGAPSWDVRFLRQLLEGNTNVDLISFFILRTGEDLQRAVNREMSLIPFPTQELFTEELGGFDLVLFQNFTFEPYEMRRYLGNVRDFVEGGGGFAMIGGDQSFSVGGYAGTEIADILPVALPPGRSAEASVDLGTFRPSLTEAGRRHPITRLAFDRAANDTLWSELPEQHGTNVVGQAVDGATVLAVHPALRAGSEPMPVVTVADRGEGRSMAVTFDESWRWSFDAVAGGGTSAAYTTFWNSAIRWLIRDPELNLVQVEIAREIFAPGDEVEAQVRVFRPDYAPAAGTGGTVEVIRRDLSRLAEDAGETVLEQAFTTDETGRWVLRYDVTEPGAYTVRAVSALDDGTPIEDDEIFLGIVTSRELRDVSPRPALLAQLSEASEGGTTRTAPPSRLRSLELSQTRIERVNRRQVVHVWNAPPVLVALALLLGLEWTLRRRWGRL